jgi:hypothetical protein
MTTDQVWFTVIYLLSVAFIMFVYPRIVDRKIRRGGPGW